MGVENVKCTGEGITKRMIYTKFNSIAFLWLEVWISPYAVQFAHIWCYEE